MKKRVNGITYLKAFLPLLVIACHARPFGPSAAGSMPLVNVPDWKDVFYSNILTLAVPVFFLISFFLYLLKRESEADGTVNLMWKRVRYFAVLFLTMRIIYYIFVSRTLWIPDRGWIRNLYHLLFAGGDTLLYYLEQMIYWIILLELCCLICERFHIERKRFALIGAGLSIFLLLGCTYAAPEVLKIEALRFFSPIGFLPLVFIAMFLFEEREALCSKESGKIFLILIVIGIVAAAAEWKLMPSETYLKNGYSLAIPYYARLSVILLSSGLFSLSVCLKRTPGKTVQFLASISLYVYCIHCIIINIVRNAANSPLGLYIIVTLLTYAVSALISVMNRRLHVLG